VLKQEDYIKGKLVEMALRFQQHYGTGGHLAGQMVMHAIANRVRAGTGTWLQVIDRIPQYMAEAELPPLEHPPLWQPEFVKLLHAVDGVVSGSTTDLSHGAMYWCDLGKIERDWFREKIIQARDDDDMPRHKRVAEMNSLAFFA